jgi:hypothetical protein
LVIGLPLCLVLLVVLLIAAICRKLKPKAVRKPASRRDRV